jgi:hypothetical protein
LRERSYAFLDACLEKEIYTIYEDPQKMPAFNYIAYELTQLPYALFFIPIITIASGLFSSINRTKSRLFESSVPLSELTMNTSHIISSSIFAFCATAVAFIPSFCYIAIKNGIGRFDYPIVNVVNDTIWAGTNAIYLGRFALLMVAGCLFLAAVMLFVSRFVDNRPALIVVALALVLVPTFPSYHDPLGSFASVLYLLPTTYFPITNIIGDTGATMSVFTPFFSTFGGTPAGLGMDIYAGLLTLLCGFVVIFLLSMLAQPVLRMFQRSAFANRRAKKP